MIYERMTRMYTKLINKTVLFLSMVAVMLTGVETYAQKPLIDVSIDSAAILIGEQTVIHLTITTDKGRDIIVPIPSDTLMTGVEVITLSKPDTSFIENDKLLIKQDVMITSFDSALYLLPPFVVIGQNDTVYSEQLALKVSTIPVDTSKPEEFADIKDTWKPPFVLADYYPCIFGTLFALLFICIIGYIAKRIRNKQSIIPFKKPEPKLPPHEQAIKELEEIKQQKLWQQGRNKEYYTLITDALRKYIVDRFDINAMEMTSSEILDLLRKDEVAKPVFDNLKQVLMLADFVKFAKMNPLPDENNQSMNNAYVFVNQTVPVVIEDEISGGSEKEDSDSVKDGDEK